MNPNDEQTISSIVEITDDIKNNLVPKRLRQLELQSAYFKYAFCLVAVFVVLWAPAPAVFVAMLLVAIGFFMHTLHKRSMKLGGVADEQTKNA